MKKKSKPNTNKREKTRPWDRELHQNCNVTKLWKKISDWFQIERQQISAWRIFIADIKLLWAIHGILTSHTSSNEIHVQMHFKELNCSSAKHSQMDLIISICASRSRIPYQEINHKWISSQHSDQLERDVWVNFLNYTFRNTHMQRRGDWKHSYAVLNIEKTYQSIGIWGSSEFL